MRAFGYTNNKNYTQTAARWLGCVLLAAAGSAAAGGFDLPVLAQEAIAPKWIIRDGPPAGMCPDIMAAIERIEPRLRFSGYRNGRSLLVIESALETGRALAACALLDSPRRRSVAQPIGKPLYTIRQRLAAAAGDPATVNSMDDLVRLRPLINTARGSAYVGHLKALGIQVDDSTGDTMVNLKKTLAGHGRFTYMNERTLAWYLQSPELKGKLRMLPTVLSEENVYFWISHKADPAAARLATEALARLGASGELARICERWTTNPPG